MSRPEVSLVRRPWNSVLWTALFAGLVLLALASAAPAGAETFTPRQQSSSPCGFSPRTVVMGDLNGDHRPDLVTAIEGGNVIEVRINDGSGGFGPGVDYSTGSTPSGVALGDLNGDGKLDMAYVDGGSSEVCVRLGNGNGTFGAATSYPSRPGGVGIVIADLNADGKLDVAATGYNAVTTGFVCVFPGNGSGGLGTRVDFPCGGQPNSLVAKDVNGDGNMDLVTANLHDGSITVLWGAGTGDYSYRSDFPSGPSTNSADAASLSGGAVLDLFAVNRGDNTLTRISYDSFTNTWTPTHIPVSQDPVLVRALDVQGSGYPDIVVASYASDSLMILPHSHAAPLGTPYAIAPLSGPYGFDVADVDGDSKPDLVVAENYTSHLRVLLARPQVGFALGDTIPSFSAPNQFGATTNVGMMRGKWLVLDFMSRWCAPCNVMGKDTQRIYWAWQGQPGIAFDYLTLMADGGTVGVASTQSDAQAWGNGFSITRPILHCGGVANGAIQALAGISDDTGFPTVRIVDPNGIVRFVQVGGSDAATLVTSMARLAGVAAPSIPVAASRPIGGALQVYSGIQVAASPMDPTRSSGYDYPFNVQGFGENFTATLDVTHDNPGGLGLRENWVLTFDHWPDPGLGVDYLPSSNFWLWVLSANFPDAFQRSLLPGTTVPVSWEDDSYTTYPTSITLPAQFSANTLAVGPLPAFALTGQPVRHLIIGPITFPLDGSAGVGPSASRNEFVLQSPSPNPVRTGSRIAWTQPHAGHARLDLFDVGGRLVRMLADGAREAGDQHAEWDLADASGARVRPGLYFARLFVAGEGVRTARVTVVD